MEGECRVTRGRLGEQARVADGGGPTGLGLKSNSPSPGTSRTVTHMVSGTVVGVLKGQHPGHLLLTDNRRISLPEGLIVEHFGPAARNVPPIHL